jgi:hypothetical protein
MCSFQRPGAGTVSCQLGEEPECTVGPLTLLISWDTQASRLKQRPVSVDGTTGGRAQGEVWAFRQDILDWFIVCVWASVGWPEPRDKEDFYKKTPTT